MALFLKLKCYSGYKNKHNSTNFNDLSRKLEVSESLSTSLPISLKISSLEMGVAHIGPFPYPKQVIFKVKAAISNGFSRLFFQDIFRKHRFLISNKCFKQSLMISIKKIKMDVAFMPKSGSILLNF